MTNRTETFRKIKALDGMTVSKTEYDEYRINYRSGREATAYYTNDLDDAYFTAVAMWAAREQRNGRTH